MDILLCPSTFEEDLDLEDFPNFSEFVEATAEGKATEVFKRLEAEGNAPDLVISADTMVALGDKLMGKPKDAAEATQMLTELNGKWHTCYSGVVLKGADKTVRFTETTRVQWGHATKEQIQAYVDSGDPLDKAGAYGINTLGGAFIPKIEGDYYTVMGLPLHRLCTELCKFYGYRIDQE